MSLVDQILVNTTWVNTNTRWANSVGTPIVSALYVEDGSAISDEFTLFFSSVVAGTSATATLSTKSANNPYNGRSKTVTLDGTTPSTDLIPGLTLVFSASGSFTSSWVSLIKLGEYFGSYSPGDSPAGERHAALNSGSGRVTNAVASLRNVAVMVKITGKALAGIRRFAVGSTEKTTTVNSQLHTMPYALTIANTTGSGSSKVADLLIDGATLAAGAVLDLQTNTTSASTALKALSTYFYRITSGPLTGLEFAIDAACANADKANVLIFPPRFLQIAPDVAGVAGTYGTSDVVLTQAGQAAGVILSGAQGFYWVQLNIPYSASAQSNPYPSNLALVGNETFAAGFTS